MSAAEVYGPLFIGSANADSLFPSEHNCVEFVKSEQRITQILEGI